ncbi:trypsin-like peptidase domain-containing protein [Aneurinibacillus sp. Ricciae_BoGa-3]|nr:trypsin-like peptidase domain-containing protein [Aneurinibacillus sp. Ricciae_BoGa-3]WCK53773.1 trypsin-like peptidase domain-containing protein [Aneurinibacillus sp. Ricciae_BoGa-3]
MSPPLNDIGTNKKLFPFTSDKANVAGYPGSADLKGFLDDKSLLVSSYSDASITAKKNSENGPVIQLAGSFNPGNSGGPVFNEAGKWRT